MPVKEILIPEHFAVDEAARLRKEMHALLDGGEKNIVLNFKNCTFIDSTGLGVIVSAYRICGEICGSLKLRNINHVQVRKVFHLTRLDRVFEIL